MTVTTFWAGFVLALVLAGVIAGFAVLLVVAALPYAALLLWRTARERQSA